MQPVLAGISILIVEDEFYLADDLAQILKGAGAHVLGPVGSIVDADAFLARCEPISLAVLDIDLVGVSIFPIADRLQAKGTPFLFATGYDRSAIPPRFAGAPRLEKPINPHLLIRACQALLAAERTD